MSERVRESGGGGMGDVMPKDMFPIFDGLLHLVSALLCFIYILQVALSQII